VEDNIYRIGVKMYFLIADKKIRIEDLSGARTRTHAPSS
jgi:hypothetical protein